MFDETASESSNFENNIGLVIAQAISFHPNKIVDTGDLIQAGSIGLLKAIRNFDTLRGTKFGTYAYSCIRGEILRELKKNPLTVNCVIDQECKQQPDVWEFMSDNMTEVERKVVMLRMEGYTYQEIGDILGYTRAWANSIMLNIIKQIKEEVTCE